MARKSKKEPVKRDKIELDIPKEDESLEIPDSQPVTEEIEKVEKPEPAPVVEEPKPKAPEQKVSDGLPKVSLRIFIASGGIKWDQMAGFKAHALANKMGPMSIADWRGAFSAFMNRPVK